MAVWHGGFSAPCHLDEEQMVAVIEKHFADCRRFYTCGTGDGHFHMVESAIRLAVEARRRRSTSPSARSRGGRRRRGIHKVHNASGFAPDVIVDDPAASLLRDQDDGSPTTERIAILRGYEENGEPINLEDDEAGA
jgi:hypothetical protein